MESTCGMFILQPIAAQFTLTLANRRRTREANDPLLMESKMRGIEITDNKNGYLTVSLKDILNALANYATSFSWSIFDLEAVGELLNVFNIARAQGEAEIKPDAMTDDFGWKSMAMIERFGGVQF
jgi:hypothetical protein